MLIYSLVQFNNGGVKKTFDNLLEEILYNNNLITIDNKAISIEYLDWKDLGILKVKDVIIVIRL